MKPSVRKLLVLLLLSLWLVAAQLPYAENFTTLTSLHGDAGWQLGMTATLRQGQWLGRDIPFTYGPLAQVLYSVGVSLNGSGSTLNGHPLTQVVLMGVGYVFLALALTLIKPLNTVWAALIVIGSVMLNGAAYAQFRVFGLALFAALLARALIAEATRARRFWVIGAGAWLLTTQLLSIDMAVYGLAAGTGVLGLLITLAWLRRTGRLPSVEVRTVQVYVEALALLWAVALLGNVLISLTFAFTSPAYPNLFWYQRMAWEVATSYSAAQGVGWMLPLLPSLVWGGLILSVAGYVVGNLPLLRFPDAHYLLCWGACAALSLRGVITRSDFGHIQLGTGLLVIVFLMLGIDWLRSDSAQGAQRYRLWQYVWITLLLALVYFWPMRDLRGLQSMAQALIAPGAVIERWRTFTTQDLLVPAELADFAEALDPALTTAALPEDDFIPLALSRPVLMPLLNVYNALSTPLQTWYADQLTQATPMTQIVYTPNRRLDNTQDVTRLPLIFDALYNAYELYQPLSGGRVLLRARSTSPQDRRVMALPFTTTNSPTATTVQLDRTAECSLVAVTLRMEYPVTRSIGRPEPLRVSVMSGDAILMTGNLVPLAVGNPFTTYLSLAESPAFGAAVFGTAPVTRAMWDRLTLASVSTGLFGVPVSAVGIEGVACITFERGEPTIATPPPAPSDADMVFDLKGEGWQPVRMTPADGAWLAGQDPQFVYTKPLSICVVNYRAIYVRLAVAPDPAISLLQLYYRQAGVPGFRGDQTATLPLNADGAMHAYLIPIHALNAAPEARLTGLRIDPVLGGATSSRVELDELRLIPAAAQQPCAPPAVDDGADLTAQGTYEFDLTVALWTEVKGMQPLQPGSAREWVVGDDPQMVYAPLLNFCVRDYEYLGIEIAASPEVTDPLLQVYYQVEGQPGFAEAHSVFIDLQADGQVGTYVFTLDAITEAFGERAILTRLRLDPVKQGTGDADSWVKIQRLWLAAGEERRGCETLTP
jgi:hypothetical protein